MVNAVQIAKERTEAVMAPPQGAVSEAKLRTDAVMAPPQTAVSEAKLRTQAVLAPPQTGLSLAKFRVFAILTTKVVYVPDFTWPHSGSAKLVPKRAALQPMAMNTTGGTGITSVNQVMGNAPGQWRLDLSDVQVKTDAQRLQWELIEVGSQGRAKTILMPIYRWMANLVPWPTIMGVVTTSAPGYASKVILTYSDALTLPGVVSIPIRVEQGAALTAGHVFEINQKVYFITEILSFALTTSSPVFPVYTVKFWPPLRERVELNDAIEFDNPRLRCRLEKDDGMNIPGGWEYWKRSSPSVSFVEDVTDDVP